MLDLFEVVCVHGVLQWWCGSAASAIEESKFYYEDDACVLSCTHIASGIHGH